MKPKVAVFWFRRDLRLEDNAGLYHALKSGMPVLPVFIFDRNILDQLDDKADRRVEFIYDTLLEMQVQLVRAGFTLFTGHGRPPDIFHHVLAEFDVKAVYTNTDYEPYATQRDEEVRKLLAAESIPFHSYKDQVIIEKNEVLKDDGSPYAVFTPYSRKWRALLNDFCLSSYPAGMRELNATGFMHNRVRMVVASFLAKHLLIDWRWGEAYFAEKLLDFDLAANNGGWQWAASSGCDAVPYFRVFNPTLQAQKFDPDFNYIRKWVPEWEGLTYPRPMVVHEMARRRALDVYARAVKEK